MATQNTISCSEYANFLISQTPFYDKEIIKDIRPIDSGLMGYYKSEPYDAYTADSHVLDRMNSVFPNLTNNWSSVDNTNCVGTPCDTDANKIGYGNTRVTYGLQQQSWETDVICFDQVMSRTRAKEHFRQIIGNVLQPATKWIMSDFLMKQSIAQAKTKKSVTTGLPDVTYTWDAGGYLYLNTSSDPTGLLTPDILRSFVRQQYFYGAVQAGKDGFDKLQLQTDMDTYHYLSRTNPALLNAWRFGDFDPAAKEFYKYGFSGFVGDFLVKVMQFPLRFNKVSAGRYQVVLPYYNTAATEGIKSLPNPAYNNAQYQFSLINDPRAITVMPFKGEAVNPMMPYMVRDYGGEWKFSTNDLGSDCQGKPIANYKVNKGKFWADFRLAIKPTYPEFQVSLFHQVDRPCITIIPTCNSDPGYPAQVYTDTNTPCPAVIVITPAPKVSNGHYVIAANSAQCERNTLPNGAIDTTTLALLVVALQADAALGALGTWSTTSMVIGGVSTNVLVLTGATCSTVNLPFTL